jgi:hypothetical protein
MKSFSNLRSQEPTAKSTVEQVNEHTDQGGVEAFLTTATNLATPQIEMPVSWHQASSPRYTTLPNTGKPKAGGRERRNVRTAGEWR